MILQAFDKYGIPYRIQEPEKVAELEGQFLSLVPRLKFPDHPFSPVHVRKLRQSLTNPDSDELHRHTQLLSFYEWVEKNLSLKLMDINTIHSSLMGKEIGLRRERIFSRERSGAVKAEFPPFEAISELMKDLQYWDENHALSMTKLLSLHLFIVSIHPFADGNGRVARALVHSGLREMGIPLSDKWHPELIVHWIPDTYLQSLRESCEKRILDPFLSDMLKIYIDTAKAFIS